MIKLMDTFFSNYLYRKYQEVQASKKEETFEDTAATPTASMTSYLVSSVFSILLGMIAVYLSWSCNTEAGINTGLKVVYAFFAFIFGGIYLLFYLLFRAGRCAPQQVVVYAQAPAPVGAPVMAPVQQQGGRRSKSSKC